jgi:hypothetical protein
MANLEIRPLKPSPNWDILNAVREDAGSLYQERIPEATKGNIQDTLERLLDYRPQWNEFVHTLVNQIGLVIMQNRMWTNPFAEFKTGLLTYGDTIEEIQVGLLRAHEYDTDRETTERDLLGTERPEVQANFHRINRQNFYKVTVNEVLLKRAFLDPMGLSKFINDLMVAPSNSDQWDEFLVTCNLFAEYERNGGFYKVNTPDVKALESGAADAKVALRKLRALAGNMKFLSTKYNAAHMPTFANAEDLLIFVTPEFNAAMDVEALAAAFNIDSVIARGRIIEIPEEYFGIEGCQGIVTTKDFFIIGDTLLETRSFENPAGLSVNFFLHHHQIISASRFVPAIMLTTGAGDEDLIVRKPVTSVSAITVEDRYGDVVTSVARGEIYSLDAEAVTDGPNDGVKWSLTGTTSNQTYVTSQGVLHVGPREGSNSIVVTATSTWIDETNPDAAQYENSTTLTVTGEAGAEWPVDQAEAVDATA